ncbi:MAG: hypothetical protein ABJ360_28190 [Roseobacter sp.]
MNASTVAEIVTFRLKPETSEQDFHAAADAMTPFLRSTGAMVSRTLSTDNDGQWTDHILWQTQEAATEASNAMFNRPEAAPFMEMIETADLIMKYAPVALYLPPE